MPPGWRKAAHARLARVDRLTRVLMKPRNGEAWTDEDRLFLWNHLTRMGTFPEFFFLMLPGGLRLLPHLARFLDRRTEESHQARQPRRAGDRRGGAIG